RVSPVPHHGVFRRGVVLLEDVKDLVAVSADDDKEAVAQHHASETPYWITSSARASTEGGIVRPSALAGLRLRRSSNFVGCSTGMSAGLVPFSTLPTTTAVWCHISDKLGP